MTGTMMVRRRVRARLEDRRWSRAVGLGLLMIAAVLLPATHADAANSWSKHPHRLVAYSWSSPSIVNGNSWSKHPHRLVSANSWSRHPHRLVSANSRSGQSVGIMANSWSRKPRRH